MKELRALQKDAETKRDRTYEQIAKVKAAGDSTLEELAADASREIRRGVLD
ncbi:hypothetical protein [Paraburkholderia sediminicola]|uniref:hypothetical protein n=1 Tax=Paraburkholderia sediminicola TaxID=458836 RepID=UPI0038B9B2FE